MFSDFMNDRVLWPFDIPYKNTYNTNVISTLGSDLVGIVKIYVKSE